MSATVWASGPSAVYAKKFTSIWPTAGFFRRAWVVNSVVFGWPGGKRSEGFSFFACSTPGGVGGQDGLRRIGRPSSATRPAGKCRTVATSDAGSSDPRPLPGAPFRLVGGTRVFACVCPFLSCGRHRHSARVRPPEVSSVGPHPVHDHCEPACEGDLRPFHAASLRDPHGPGSER